jgi:pyridoxine 4-dehydrogenase
MIQVSPIGVGTWAWGNKLLWGYDTKDDEEIQRAFDYILSQ